MTKAVIELSRGDAKLTNMNEAARFTVIYSILVHTHRKQTDPMPLFFRLNVLHKKVKTKKNKNVLNSA